MWLEMDNYATNKILFCDEITNLEYNLELFNKKGFGNGNTFVIIMELAMDI